jgi:hypothetical protein
MKRTILAGTILFSAAAAPTLAHASGSTAATHSGFFTNISIGAGASNYVVTGHGNKLQAKDGAASLNLRLGAALTPHLVLSGVLGGSATITNPDTTLNGYSLTLDEDHQFTTAMLGVGLTWYFDNNLFLGADVGTGQAGYLSDSANGHSDNGFAAQIRFGKEWWVSSNWALGIVAGFKYLEADADTDLYVRDGYRNSRYVYFDHVKASTLYVGFSATFN